MTACQSDSVDVCGRLGREEWAQEYAKRMGRRFEQWQKSFDIDNGEYLKYLTEDFVDCCDDPLLKSLIESIA